ncbi:MAG: ABC transporter substrate-binding protein [Bacillota bacterium]|nr:ABC transporter substrate-binding protein [Bacillota bacterium]
MRKAVVVAALLVLVSALFVGGCGKTPAEQAKPTRFTYATGVEPESLDPANALNVGSTQVIMQVYEGLVCRDENLKVYPRLATSWDISPDKKVYTFHLREGVKFHDGTPFDAEAVKANLDRHLNLDKPTKNRQYYAMVESIVVKDHKTVEIRLKQPYGSFLELLAQPHAFIVSPQAIAELGEDLARRAVGTGPFVLKEWVPGSEVIMEANREYWGGKPEIDELVFKPVNEDGARVMMLESGQADMITYVPPAEIETLRQKGFKVVLTPTTRQRFVSINCLDPILKDKRVRQALNYAVNKKAIVDLIWQGTAEVSDSPIPPRVWGHFAVGAYEYNPDKAKQLLAEAGYPNGFAVNFWYIKRGPGAKEIMEAIQADLRKVGVNAKIQEYEPGIWVSGVLNKGPEDAQKMGRQLLMLGSSGAEVRELLWQFHHSSNWSPGGMNRAFLKNAQIDELTDKLMVATEEGEALALAEQAQKLVMDEAPWIFLYSESQARAMKANVEGVIIPPMELEEFYKVRFTK